MAKVFLRIYRIPLYPEPADRGKEGHPFEGAQGIFRYYWDISFVTSSSATSEVHVLVQVFPC